MQRQVGIERLHLLADDRSRRQGIARGAHVEQHHRGITLRDRHVGIGLRRRAEAVVAGVRRHSHDLQPGGLALEAEALAEGALAGPQPARQGLVDDRHRAAAGAVLGQQSPAAADGDAHRLEVAGTDAVDADLDAAAVGAHGLTGGLDAEAVAAFDQQEGGGHGRRAHPGQDGDALDRALVELLSALGRVAARAEVERDHEQPLALEAGVNRRRLPQAVQEEAGAHQDDDREGDLGDQHGGAHRRR